MYIKYIFIPFFIILFGCFNSIRFSSAVLDTVGITPLYDLCPYTNYCTRNATKRLMDETKTPCCGQCSCADDCWERGNCCVDKQSIIVKQPLESCMEAVVKSGRFHGIPMNLPRYYVIQNCPTVNDTLAEKCRGNYQSSFDDYIWVTDKRTNKIYNNKHCAECHGVTTYTKWQIGTDCLVSMDGNTSPAEAITRIMLMCSLFVLPPRSTDQPINQCIVPTFSTCNVTRKWQTYDKALETACHNFDHLFHQDNGLHFKNVYCYLCNSRPRDQIVKDICEANTKPISKTDFLGFTAILDFTVIEKEKKEESGGGFRHPPVCAIDEILDPYQGRCLKLTCPMLHVPVYGKCEKLISSTNLLGLSATLMLYLTPIKPNMSAELELEVKGFAEKLFNKLQRSLGLVKGKCQLREEYLCGTFENKSFPDMIAIRIRYTTTEECQEDFIIERMQWLLNNTVKIQFDKEFVSFIATALSPMEYVNYCTSARNKYHVGKWTTIEYIDFQRFIDCQSVSLNVTHYKNLMKQATETSQRRAINGLFNLTELGNNLAQANENFTAQVCFQAYSSVLQQTNDAPYVFIHNVTEFMIVLFGVVYVLQVHERPYITLYNYKTV